MLKPNIPGNSSMKCFFQNEKYIIVNYVIYLNKSKTVLKFYNTIILV